MAEKGFKRKLTTILSARIRLTVSYHKGLRCLTPWDILALLTIIVSHRITRWGLPCAVFKNPISFGEVGFFILTKTKGG
jgi:hypothetical protein